MTRGLELVLGGTAMAMAASAAVVLLAWLALLAIRKRRPRRYWRRAAWVLLALVPVHAVVTVPSVFAAFVVFGGTTRPDERAYAGPRLDAGGRWILQDRDSLAAEKRGDTHASAQVLDAARARAVWFTAGDGTKLRAFLVPPPDGVAPRFCAVLVHGLFRGALELEPPASMLRDLGGCVLLLEMRQHGGSDRKGRSFGWHEAEDVRAAADFVRGRAECAGRPLILFGVSLGAAAVALAAPDVAASGRLDGLVLDAPLAALGETAHHMLTDERVALPEPFATVFLRALQVLGRFDVDDVVPIRSVARLPADLPVLVIGAGRDWRIPAETVRAVFDAVPAPPAPEGTKELWIDSEATHGKVWEEDPQGYAERLARLVERAIE